jgi:hypothetical protein
VFDLHLYGEASRIPTDIETARGMMRAFGYEKPLVAGEYNAPWPNLYPEATAAMQQALAAAFAAGAGGPAGQGADAGQQTPEQAAIASLYERMASLPPQLQMFMRGCPQELEDKRHRINCREIVMRNLLALSAGVRRTLCWNLAPEVPGYENPLSVMDLLFGKFALLDYRGGELGRPQPVRRGVRPAGRPARRRRAGDPPRGAGTAQPVRVRGGPHRTGAAAGGVGAARLLPRRGRAAGGVPLALAGSDGDRRRRHGPSPARRGGRRSGGATGVAHPVFIATG